MYSEFYYPQYQYDYSNDLFPSDVQGIMIGIFGILFIALFAMLITAAQYIFQSIGLYSIAKNRGMKNPFIAFIPFANVFYFGKIADDIDATMNKKSNYATKLILFYIITSVISMIAFPFAFVAFVFDTYIFSAITILLFLLAAVFSICYLIFFYVALYKIYKEYSPSNALLFEILSILCQVTTCVFLFIIRNNKSGYQIWLENMQNNAEAQPEQQEIQPDDDVEETEEIIEESEETIEESEETIENSEEIEQIQAQQEYNPFETEETQQGE